MFQKISGDYGVKKCVKNKDETISFKCSLDFGNKDITSNLDKNGFSGVMENRV